MSVRTYAVVGSGIAALSACESLRATDPTARIRLYSPEPLLFYSRPALAYFAARMLPESRLLVRTATEIAELEIQHVAAAVDEVDAARHEVVARGERHGFDRVLIATGAASIPLPAPGSQLKGVLRVDGVGEAREFRHVARWADEAVVVGGGSTAVEMAEALRTHGVTTHYFLRGDRYWSRVLDAEESKLVELALGRHGIKLHVRTELAEIMGRRGAVVGVRTASGDVVPAQIVVGAIGIRPRLAVVDKTVIATDKGILTDQYLATNAADVFAAGDVAQVYDPATGRADLDTLWHSALEQGRAAGLNMAGVTTAYEKAVAVNVTRLGGLSVAIIGQVGAESDPDIMTLTRGQSERWVADPNAWTLSRTRVENRIRVLLNEHALVGAVVIGDQQHTPALIRAISKRSPVNGIQDRLTEPPERVLDLLLQSLS